MTINEIQLSDLNRLFNLDYLRLEPGKCLYRLHRYFCKPMRRNCRCTQYCRNCLPHLEFIFRPFTDPHDPYALLVWRMRERVAEVAEAAELSANPQTNWLGEVIEADPFQLLMNNL